MFSAGVSGGMAQPGPSDQPAPGCQQGQLLARGLADEFRCPARHDARGVEDAEHGAATGQAGLDCDHVAGVVELQDRSARGCHVRDDGRGVAADVTGQPDARLGESPGQAPLGRPGQLPVDRRRADVRAGDRIADGGHVGPLLHLRYGIAVDDFRGEVEQARQPVGGIGVGDGHQEAFHTEQHRCQREGALVGAAHDEGLPTDLATDDPGGRQVLLERADLVGIRHDQPLDLVQARDDRRERDRRRIGQVLHAHAAGLGEGSRAALHEDDIVAIATPAGHLALGHGLAAVEVLDERGTRGPCGDHEVVQVYWDAVGDAACQHRLDAFDRSHHGWPRLSRRRTRARCRRAPGRSPVARPPGCCDRPRRRSRRRA